MKTSKILLILLPLAVVGGVAIVASADAPSELAQSEESQVVRTAPAVSAPETRTVHFHAAVRASEQALVAFAQPGRMVERLAEVGDTVEQGQELARLDESPLRNQQRSADAAIADIEEQLEQLDRESERARRLIAAEVGSGQSLERIESSRRQLIAARDAASARRSEARRLRDETTIVAPVAGVVTEVYAQPGEVVGAGSPILMLVGQASVEVEFDVPESTFTHVREADVLMVDFPMSGIEGMRGTVTAAGRASGSRGRLFPVVVLLGSNENVWPGMAARVAIEVPIESQIAAPVGAVVDPTGSGATVFRVVDNRVERVAVEVAGIEGDVALILGQVAVGDQLIVAGHGGVRDGQLVEARQ
ncbi:MAG: RND family efflux transporter MFP subunit [Bradymonadia bacterium]|jgi:RND family efflux transporter MFP subunit